MFRLDMAPKSSNDSRLKRSRVAGGLYGPSGGEPSPPTARQLDRAPILTDPPVVAVTKHGLQTLDTQCRQAGTLL